MKTTLRESQIWRQILSAHVARQSTPPKLVVDEEFLSRWEAGELSEREHQELVNELAQSQESRRIVKLLVDSGALTLPASERDDMPEVLRESERPTVMSDGVETRVSEFADPPVFASAKTERAGEQFQSPTSQKRSMSWLPVAGLIAAGLIVAVTLSLMNPSGNQSLQSAVASLENNDFQAAFDQADRAIEVAANDEQREAAFEIMCESGEQLADTALTEGRFEDVRLISDRVSDHSDVSATAEAATQEVLGRLESLRLQARRGMTSAIALSQFDSLSDYYANVTDLVPDWLNPDTEGGMTQVEIDEIREEYEQAIGDFPLSRNLRLNYGQFLLEQHQTEEAIAQFRAILEGNEVVGLIADPENRDALVGMAIALFKNPNGESASDAMQQLLELVPSDDAAADILETIQGNLDSRVRDTLLPGGVVPSVDTLEMLRDSLQNLRPESDPSDPQPESTDAPM